MLLERGAFLRVTWEPGAQLESELPRLTHLRDFGNEALLPLASVMRRLCGKEWEPQEEATQSEVDSLRKWAADNSAHVKLIRVTGLYLDDWEKKNGSEATFEWLHCESETPVAVDMEVVGGSTGGSGYEGPHVPHAGAVQR